MEVHIGLKHVTIVKLRDELTEAIEKNPDGRDGRTEVILYGNVSDRHHAETITISNDDCERDDVSPEELYVEVER